MDLAPMNHTPLPGAFVRMRRRPIRADSPTGGPDHPGMLPFYGAASPIARRHSGRIGARFPPEATLPGQSFSTP